MKKLNLTEATALALEGKLAVDHSNDIINIKDFYDTRDVLLNRVADILFDAKDKLERLEKPDAYSFGGTYYGSSEILSHRSNILEIVENKWQPGDYYTSGYSVLMGLKIGGAYDGINEVKIIENEIMRDLKELKPLIDAMNDFIDTDNGKSIPKHYYHIIDKYGTNYSIYGISDR